MSRSHGRKGIKVGRWSDSLPVSSQEQMNAAQGDGEQPELTGRWETNSSSK